MATEHQQHPEALINPVYAKDDSGNRYPTQLPDWLPGVISQLNDSYDEEGTKSVIETYTGSSADIADAYDYRARGEFYLQGGEYGKAIADYTEAIGLDSNKASAHCGRGEAYAQMGEYERAIADFREAIRLDPASAYAHALKGRVYFQTGDYEQAIADFSEAIRLDPTDAYAHGIRGWACRLQGYLITAINDLTEALRLDPTLGWAEEQLSLARGERR